MTQYKRIDRFNLKVMINDDEVAHMLSDDAFAKISDIIWEDLKLYDGVKHV